MAIFEMTSTERDEFTPDTYAADDWSETALTAEAYEERMSAILEAWGWTEEKRDEETEYGERVHDEAWRTDTEAAHFVAVNSPSNTPIDIFTAILEAKGWPRDPYGING